MTSVIGAGTGVAFTIGAKKGLEWVWAGADPVVVAIAPVALAVIGTKVAPKVIGSDAVTSTTAIALMALAEKFIPGLDGTPAVAGWPYAPGVAGSYEAKNSQPSKVTA